MRYKCIFLNLYTNAYENRSENLGLEKLLRALEINNYAAKVLNIGIESYDDISLMESVIGTIKEYEFEILGVPIFSTSIVYVDELFKRIKEWNKSVVTITGGFLATNSTREVAEFMNYVDYLFCGSAESLIVEFCDNLDKKDYVKGMCNIAYKENKQIIINPRNKKNVLKDLQGWADRSYLIEKNIEVVRLQTARGCTGKCAFCTEFENWIGKSPQDIVSEMRYIVETYNVNTFNIVDSSFEDPTPGCGKLRIREFCETILKEKLDVFFTIYIRAESFDERDEDLLILMKKAGLITVFIGIESGNDETLKLFNKRSCVSKNTRVIELMEKIGINVEIGFIMFHPYETLEQLRENLEFFKRNRYVADNISSYVNSLFVYPSTVIHKKLLADNMLLEEYSIAQPQAYKYVDSRVAKVNELMKKINSDELYALWEELQKMFNLILKAERYEGFINVSDFRKGCNEVKNELIDANLELFQKILWFAEEDIDGEEGEEIQSIIEKFSINDKKRKLHRLKFQFIKDNILKVDLIIKRPKIQKEK